MSEFVRSDPAQWDTHDKRLRQVALDKLAAVALLEDGWEGDPNETETPAPTADAVERARVAINEGFDRGLLIVDVDPDVLGGVGVTFYDDPATRHVWIACMNYGNTHYVCSGRGVPSQSGPMSPEAWPAIVAFLRGTAT